jgi:hypothetical protein
VEGLVHFVPLSLNPHVLSLLVDAQANEEGLEEVAPYTVRSVAVELSWIAKECEVCQRSFGTVAKSFDGATELLLDETLLQGGLFQLLPEPRDRVGAACCQIDKTFFLCFQLLQLTSQPCFRLLVCYQKRVDGFGDQVGEVVDRLGIEPLRRHELDDLVFEQV